MKPELLSSQLSFGIDPKALHERLVGGGFEIVQARSVEGCVSNSTEAAALSRTLKASLDQHLQPDDRVQIAAITAQPYEALEQSVLALDSCELTAVLSNARFVPRLEHTYDTGCSGTTISAIFRPFSAVFGAFSPPWRQEAGQRERTAKKRWEKGQKRGRNRRI